MKGNILRVELEPQIRVAEELFSRVFDLISLFDEGYENEDKEKMDEAIHQMNLLTGKDILPEELFEYWEAESQEELAFKLSLPEPLKVDHITKEELVEIIRRMQSFDDDGIPDKLSIPGVPLSSVLTCSYYDPLLKRHFSYPDPLDLLERQLINGEYTEYSAGEIADIIMSHRAIML